MVKSECFGKKGTTLGISKYGQKQLKQRESLEQGTAVNNKPGMLKYKKASAGNRSIGCKQSMLKLR